MKRFRQLLEDVAVVVPHKDETAGIPRHKMPQIPGKHVDAILKELEAATGKRATTTEVDPGDLKPTQGNFNKDKITGCMKSIEDGEKQYPIIVSSDNFIMDGHHRWLGHINTNQETIKVHRVDAVASELLSFLQNHKLTQTKGINEGADSCSIITPLVMKKFEETVDKLFAPFKMDFDFTKHFRERMGDARNNPCIDLKELANMIKKLYAEMKAGGKSLTKHMDTEVVIKDMQSDLNMPIALEYDHKNDTIDVIAKTIMRKKNFSTPNPVVKV